MIAIIRKMHRLFKKYLFLPLGIRHVIIFLENLYGRDCSCPNKQLLIAPLLLAIVLIIHNCDFSVQLAPEQIPHTYDV